MTSATNTQSALSSPVVSGLNPSVCMKVLAWACAALVVETFILISVGGVVRNAGAGLSCPDWPLCFGKVVPPMDYRVFLEWFHRLMAGTISILLIGVAGLVAYRSELRRSFGPSVALAIALLFAQIVLGGLTVLGLLHPMWVSSHLAIALLFFGVTLRVALKASDWNRPAGVFVTSGPGRLPGLATAVTVIFYGQILLGGLVSSNYAGLACLDFPTCNGLWVPPLEGLVKFQFLHRVGALVASGAVVALVLAAARYPLSKRGRLALWSLPVLLVVQLFLGIGSVLFSLPLPMSVAHLATATAMFGMLLVVGYEIRRA